jgi:CH-like domain in sperm protein
MLSRYFPNEANMHSFVNGTSTATRADNWAQVQKACRKNGFQLPQGLVADCQAERAGATNAMLELLYEHLTGREIRRPEEVRWLRCAHAGECTRCDSACRDIYVRVQSCRHQVPSM